MFAKAVLVTIDTLAFDLEHQSEMAVNYFEFAVKAIDIFMSCTFYLLMFRLKYCQIIFQSTKTDDVFDISTVEAKIRLLQFRIRCAVLSFFIMVVTYFLTFQLIFLLYKDNQTIIKISNAITLVVFIPYRIVETLFIIYFWHIGKWFISQLGSNQSSNKARSL